MPPYSADTTLPRQVIACLWYMPPMRHGVIDERPTFSEFAPHTRNEWRDVAVASLKGVPYEKALISRSYEDIEVRPIYWAEDLAALTHVASVPGFSPFVRGCGAGGYVTRPWDVCQELWASTPEAFSAVAAHDLARGQTALGVVLDGPTRRGRDPGRAEDHEVGTLGLSLCSLEDVQTTLAAVQLETTPFQVAAGATALPLVAALAAYARCAGVPARALQGCVGADPLGELAREGSIPLAIDQAYDVMASVVRWTRAEAPSLRTLLVQGCPYHDAGASAVQELGFAVATGVAVMRALIDRGLDVGEVAASVRFTFSIGGDFFMEVAKLRAARMLWSRVVDAFGGDAAAQEMSVHGRTSARTKTVLDPYVNMLRNTTEAFSAVVGGVDSLHVRPFDEPIRPPTEFSRRVSRNVQLLLRNESHLTVPIDPSGGSYYVEELTDRVAAGAWDVLRQVELRGGMLAALEAGFPQDEVAAVAARRAASLASRRDVLVGTNQYANPTEVPLDVPKTDRAALARQRRDEVARFVAGRSGTDAARARALDTLRSGPDVAAAVEAVLAGATLGELYAAIGGAVPRERERERERLHAGKDAMNQEGEGQGEGPKVRPLHTARTAEPFERLRARMERVASQRGKRARVFLANIGPLAQHKARGDFTRGFFEVGGFEVVGNDGFSSAEDAARAATESGAEVVVVCSTDAAYPAVVPDLARRIKAAGRGTWVVLAGKPAPEHEAAYREAGLDDFISIKSNVLDVLERLVPGDGTREVRDAQ